MSGDWNGFKGAAKPIEDLDLPRIGHRIGVGEDEIHAVLDVESSGSGFDGQKRPKMLFEPHIFYRELGKGAKRSAAVKQGLAYPKWKSGAYPSDSYPRLIKAMQIDETAALRSASWGLGQIMGFNHEAAGYSTVEDMVRAFMEDEEHHLDAMVSFIIKNKLDRHLRSHNWAAFAKGYNGAGYAANKYDVKLAASFKKWQKIRDTPWTPGEPIVIAATPPPPVVSQKEVIKQVQTLLRDKGYAEVGEVEGVFGTRTRNAILAFEADNDLPLTGQVTDRLMAELVKAPKRPVAASRENATAKDLADKPIVQQGGWLRRLGMGIFAISGLGAVTEGTANIDDVTNGVSKLKGLTDAVVALGPWVLGGIAGALVIYFGGRLVRKYVEAYQEGRAF